MGNRALHTSCLSFTTLAALAVVVDLNICVLASSFTSPMCQTQSTGDKTPHALQLSSSRAAQIDHVTSFLGHLVDTATADQGHVRQATRLPSLWLSSNLSSWAYPNVAQLGYVAEPPAPHPALAQRFWDAHHLTTAAWSLGLVQLQPLLAKLQRGEPVMVAAWGSRVAEAFGGMFQPSAAHLRRTVTQLPRVYHKHSDAQSLVGGWLSLFMHALNASWPHANHTLVNAGGPGLDLRVLRHCHGELLPDPAPSSLDLAILENRDGATPGPALERLVYRILAAAARRGRPAPAIIILNSAAAYNASSAPLAWRDCLRHAPCLCSTLCGSASGRNAFDSLMDGPAYQGDARGGLVRQHSAALLGSYYGVSVVSLRQLYQALIRDGLATNNQPAGSGDCPAAAPAPDPASALCGVIGTTFEDRLHPSPLGQVLYADLLVNLMRLAATHAQQQQQQQQRQQRRQRRPPGLPQVPLWRGGHSVSERHTCLIVDGASTRFGKGLRSVRVMTKAGWHRRRYQDHFEDIDGVYVRHKPGWTADAPGAHLRIGVVATLGGRMAHPNTTRFVMEYLASQEGMGTVNVTCGPGCPCQPQLVDAHALGLPHSEGVHLLHAWSFKVMDNDSSAPCEIGISLTNVTSSGGYRFKLVGLSMLAIPIRAKEAAAHASAGAVAAAAAAAATAVKAAAAATAAAEVAAADVAAAAEGKQTG